MRALIVADVHSNLAALQAVLDDCARRGGFDRVWCLGDAVGYGPDPEECLSLLRGQGAAFVAGNHDLGVAGVVDLGDFNDAAAEACIWTAGRLAAGDIAFLSALPEVAHEDDFTLVHGSLRRPVWEYLVNEDAALATFRLMETRFCLVGHSHTPFVCRERGRGCEFEAFPEGEPVVFGVDRLILNPGSVGQPRDGDPRASYAVYDSDSGAITHSRAEYDIAATQARMRLAGLPEMLAERLSFGR